MNEKIKKIAVEAMKKSGKMLLPLYENFNRHDVRLKAHKETLTKADLASEKIIIGAIKKNFPEHAILSEESGLADKKSDYLWIIDPIDGSTSFTMHSPLWSISVAVAYKKELILGLVFLPVLKEFFMAEKGKGAFLNGRKIKVSNFREGKNLNTYCHARLPGDIKRVVKYYSYQKLHENNCQQLGSAAIELCYVASGRVESYCAFGANAWDVAGGVMMVREAGGQVTDFKGKKWTIDDRDILATNGKVHKSLLKIINAK